MSAASLVWLGVLVWILGTIFVFVDATVNSSQSSVLWGLVALFGGVLGILLYVLLGRDGGDEKSPSSAPGAGGGPAEFTHECETCGERFYSPYVKEMRECGNCGGIHVVRVAPWTGSE